MSTQQNAPNFTAILSVLGIIVGVIIGFNFIAGINPSYWRSNSGVGAYLPAFIVSFFFGIGGFLLGYFIGRGIDQTAKEHRDREDRYRQEEDRKARLASQEQAKETQAQRAERVEAIKASIIHRVDQMLLDDLK